MSKFEEDQLRNKKSTFTNKNGGRGDGGRSWSSNERSFIGGEGGEGGGFKVGPPC